jgi:hypothetical protein
MAGRDRITLPQDLSLDGSRGISPIPNGFGIAVELKVSLPGMPNAEAAALVHLRRTPYALIRMAAAAILRPGGRWFDLDRATRGVALAIERVLPLRGRLASALWPAAQVADVSDQLERGILGNEVIRARIADMSSMSFSCKSFVTRSGGKSPQICTA